MKRYLSLVREYDRVHKKKSRLTVLCIAISVMLVTAVFGMADMSVQAQIQERIRQGGLFHAVLTDVPGDVVRRVAARPDIAVSGYIGAAKDAQWQGHTLRMLGGEEDMVAQMNLAVRQGRYPETADEVLLDEAALLQFGISIGDSIDVTLSDGQARRYVITGNFGDFSMLEAADAHGLVLSMAGASAMPEGAWEQSYFLQFKPRVNINRAVADIQRTYGLADSQVSKNTILLGLMGQSDDSSMLQLYLTAGMLFVLVAMAGAFMIASSFNMSVLQRTQFFGLLRCLGATKKQVRRYIRAEGLLYCLKAIPVGLLAGCALTWGALYVLNALNSSYLPTMPVFQLSLPGLAAGGVLGGLVVMLASRSPAKKASAISPQAAVTGNINHTNNLKVRKASDTKRLRVDTAMGVSHAFSNKKSLTLIAGSYALSIILFLCFTVMVDFMGNALKPLKPYAPDLSVMRADGAALDRSWMDKMKRLPHLQNIYGRMVRSDISATGEQGDGKVLLISYDEPQFKWAQDMLVVGSVEGAQNSTGVLVSHSYKEKLGFHTGDAITLALPDGNRTVQVAGILSDSPFDAGAGEWILICSEPTFTALTGIADYTIIDMQVNQDIADQVRRLLPEDVRLMDQQRSNKEIRAMYNAMAVFVYGFLAVIALVALINMINTVNASVASRTGNLGVMRAVGMSARQLRRMVLAEAAAYAVTGMILGSALGLGLHRFCFEQIITSNWGQPWQPPVALLSVVLLAGALTTALAVISPAKKIARLSIVNVVNAQ